MPLIETQYSSPNYGDRNGKVVSLLVLHATVGGLQSSVSWLCSPKSGASTHYLISKTGRILQLVPEHRSAWHAGRAFWHGEKDVNAISVGIELENLTGMKLKDGSFHGQDPYPVSQLRSLTELAYDLMQRYKLGREQIVSHAAVAVPKGRKTDPAGFPWDAWLVTLPNDPFELWGPIGKPSGVATGFAVPRAWLVNKRLGRCVSPETYAPSGAYSVTEFDNGLILYFKRRNATSVEMF